MHRRVFFIFIAGIVTFIAALVFLLTRQPGTNDQNNTLPRADAPGLTITNAGQYSDRLDLSVFTDIQNQPMSALNFMAIPASTRELFATIVSRSLIMTTTPQHRRLKFRGLNSY
jgi:hypothetical protein